MTQGSRPLGTFSSSTFVTVAPVPVRRTSSSGASAVTVIDSDTEGFSTIVTSLLRPMLTVSPERVAVPYPANSALRLYAPGDRLMKRKLPSASVTVVCGAPTPVRMTVTPGRTDPSFAWTLP